MELQEFTVGDTTYAPRIVATRNRNAYARVRGGEVIISLPASMRGGRAESVALELYSKIRRSMERHPERYSASVHGGLSLCDGDSVTLMGRTFTISVSGSEERQLPPHSGRARGRLVGDGVVSVVLPAGLDGAERERLSTRLASRVIGKALRPSLERRVRDLNALHFNSRLGKIRFSYASMRWGSCTSRGREPPSISISFRLLFMPGEYMDYVIVHELAHTVRHDHSREFWGLVAGAMPGYKPVRKELGNRGDALMSLPLPLGQAASGPA